MSNYLFKQKRCNEIHYENALSIYTHFNAVHFSTYSFAHQLSTSYITLNSENNNDTSKNLYTGTWQINIADLEHAVPLDLDKNGQISWTEIKAKRSSINNFIKENLNITQSAQICPLKSEGIYQLDNHFNQPYLVIPLQFSCDDNEAITLSYSAFLKLMLTINPS
ncbi:hypothetical protein P4S57_18345 [Pseudoalteromonas sp. Hal273]